MKCLLEKIYKVYLFSRLNDHKMTAVLYHYIIIPTLRNALCVTFLVTNCHCLELFLAD